MRQIPIEKFKRDMKSEIKDLPFEVTRRGVILFIVNHAFKSKSEANHAVEDIKVKKVVLNHAFEPKGLNNPIEMVKKQLVEVIEKKKKCTQLKATIPTEETTTFGFPKSHQCRKKVK